MQWSPERNAGFTDGEPWLPIADNYREVNVEVQRDDPTSMLTLHRRLIELRRGEPALEVGRYRAIAADDDVLAYVRSGRAGESSFLIALNLGSKFQVFHAPEGADRGTIAVSTHLDREGQSVGGEVELRPNEGVVVRLAEP